MFLEKSELKTVGVDEIISRIVNNDDSIVSEIIAENIDLMSTYLHEYYDTTIIFSATDDDRSKTLLKHLKGLVIHDIYIRRTKGVNEAAKVRADEALLWLEKVASGKIKPMLPVRTEDSDGNGIPDKPATFLKLGSRKNYQNGW